MKNPIYRQKTKFPTNLIISLKNAFQIRPSSDYKIFTSNFTHNSSMIKLPLFIVARILSLQFSPIDKLHEKAFRRFIANYDS